MLNLIFSKNTWFLFDFTN